MMTSLPITMAPDLIGLTGAVGAGKDEAAAVLKRAGWRGMAFADALRIEAAEAWDVSIDQFVQRPGKDRALPGLAVQWCLHRQFVAWAAYQGESLSTPRSPRWAMQRWGSYRRDADPLYWVHQVEHWITYQRSIGHRKLVISDVRMPNEADMLRRLGAHMVRVHRPDTPAMDAETATHESERHTTLQCDADVHNDGTLEHLANEVQRVLLQLSHHNLAALQAIQAGEACE